MPKPILVFLLLLVPLACTPLRPQSTTPDVRPGLEVLLEDLPAVLRGKRVGLITNHTAVDRAGTSAIDLLHAASGLQLVALFSPEHGIRGTAAAGERVDSGRDERTGLPIHSLYGQTRKPTPAMLEGVEALIFDIQDIGARPYTYISTMSLAMEAAAERGIPLVVLDRPNPIGGEVVEGNILEPAFRSFVGVHPIPVRHGMTVGELARLFNAEFGIGADLTVVPVQGWTRSAWLDETGLPWLNPSPNIRRLQAAGHYPGTVFFEGTNLSEGRGTALPFEQTGAPWLDAEAVAAEMNGRGLPGVRFQAVSIPVDSAAAKYPGETLPGVRLILVDRESYRPVRTTLLLIDAIRRAHPQSFQATEWLDRLGGTARLREALRGGEIESLLARWDEEAERFREQRRPYLLYP